MRVFGSKSRSATEPLPERRPIDPSDRSNSHDVSQDVPAAGIAHAQVPSIAVVDSKLCATEHTQIKLRENLSTYCGDKFDVSSVDEQKVWMKVDGQQCSARNSKMFWAPCGKPMAAFSESGNRMTAALRIDGDGFSFLVRMGLLVELAMRISKLNHAIALNHTIGLCSISPFRL